VSAAASFELPPALEAHEPPEARGLARDDVRLLVATRSDGRLEHARFRDLPAHLRAGDLLVVNTSATVPAAVDARRDDGTVVELRFATVPPHLPDGRWWLVELRLAGGAAPLRGARAGERLALPGGAGAELLAPWAGSARLWLARLDGEDPAGAPRTARPLRLRPRAVAARGLPDRLRAAPGERGDAQRGPSLHPRARRAAGRRGVHLAPILLHAGLSSPEIGEPPLPERLLVCEHTARLVNAVRGWGGRVVAVGTTVVRALESAASQDGTVEPVRGFTRLVVTPERGLRVVDGLVTGWHEPRATHLELLEAAAGPELLARSYADALREGYLWHEFGDSHLVLP
jgi:S-adenosylmethionine:tRNA ribosyltransferase-isomerase